MHAGRAGRALVALVGAVLFASGCYHAIIETGRPQSGTMIERKWAHSYLAGLVPPSTTETASRCPNGVAKVETHHSFLNLVAEWVTFFIYSPLTIQVWCAGPGSPDQEWNVLRVPDGAGAEQVRATFEEAVRQSASSGSPVFVRFEGVKP